eukprot:8311576-Heterocapsa_arctica.AAC.1
MAGWDGRCVRAAGGSQGSPKVDSTKTEKKRGPEEDPKELRERTEAELAGKAMDQSSGGLAEEIPG